MKHINPSICRLPVFPFGFLACVSEALPRRVQVIDRRKSEVKKKKKKTGMNGCINITRLQKEAAK